MPSLWHQIWDSGPKIPFLTHDPEWVQKYTPLGGIKFIRQSGKVDEALRRVLHPGAPSAVTFKDANGNPVAAPATGPLLGHALALQAPNMSQEDRDRYEAYFNQVQQSQGDAAAQQWAAGALAQQAAKYQAIADPSVDTSATQTDPMVSMIDQLVNSAFPQQQPYDPVQLMNAQAQFMAPYLSHLDSLSPQVKASYAQQAMTFPLAYQIQQQSDRQSKIDDLRSQLYGSAFGNYLQSKFSTSGANAGLTLSGNQQTTGTNG